MPRRNKLSLFQTDTLTMGLGLTALPAEESEDTLGSHSQTVAITSTATGGVTVTGAHSQTVAVTSAADGTVTATAFPQVAATNTGSVTTNGTSHAVNMPAGVAVGNLLVVAFATDGNPTITIGSGTGWSQLNTDSSGTVCDGAVFHKVADGSDALTITTSGNEQSSHRSWRITGAQGAVEAATVDSDGLASANANTASLSPSWGAADTLWMSIVMHDATTVATAAPANYGNLETVQHANGVGASISSARRELNAASEDPGAFTVASDEWVSFTLAIRPA